VTGVSIEETHEDFTVKVFPQKNSADKFDHDLNNVYTSLFLVYMRYICI